MLLIVARRFESISSIKVAQTFYSSAMQQLFAAAVVYTYRSVPPKLKELKSEVAALERKIQLTLASVEPPSNETTEQRQQTVTDNNIAKHTYYYPTETTHYRSL